MNSYVLRSASISLALIFGLLLYSPAVFACNSSFTLKLKNIHGGFHAHQTVTLTSKKDGKAYSTKSDKEGLAKFSLPCEQTYSVSVSNYTRPFEVKTPAGGMMSQTLSYERNMAEKDRLFAMTHREQVPVDKTAMNLPDSVHIKGASMPVPTPKDHFAFVKVSIEDLDGKPLASENVCFSANKRGKKLCATTNKEGQVAVYLPKGDSYALDFKYDKGFRKVTCEYSRGESKTGLEFSYLGTIEIEKRKEEERLRLLAEEKRLKAERDALERYCDKRGLSMEDCMKRRMEESTRQVMDTVVTAVLNRNPWKERLIVCDLTGSMSPYSQQLSIWYQLRYLKEKDLQFVFFNDGDRTPDADKKIGKTGGIYYSPHVPIDDLRNTMAKVAAAGGGGDGPENNMEALIKGEILATPYKELIMIADNNAPVKDIELLKNFDHPVHIILCGFRTWVHPDYLQIAWETGGSVHTIEEDITEIAGMLEDEEITIGINTYRIMGSRFIKITSL